MNNNEKILYHLNEKLKTNYIRARIKESIFDPIYYGVDTEWTTSEWYEEDNQNAYLNVVKDNLDKLNNYYSFITSLSNVKLSNLPDIYQLGIDDSYIINCINGLEWELNNLDEELDNELVQAIINSF